VSTNSEDKTGRGESPDGFSVATKQAVEDYESKHGKPKPGEPITLRILELHVTVENPVRDYIVIVGPGG